MKKFQGFIQDISLVGCVSAVVNLRLTSLGGSEACPLENLRPLRLHFRPILTKIRIDKENLQFVIILHLALLLHLRFFWGGGGGGGASQGSSPF